MSFLRRISDDSADDRRPYIFTLRGTLKRAPVGSPNPASVYETESERNAAEQKSSLWGGQPLNSRDIGSGVVIPQPTTDAYSPYAAKWKEFDKLQKQMKGGKFRWLDIVWGVILPLIGLFDPHHIRKKDELWLVGAGAAIAVLALIRAQQAKYRFSHWPCPRCGAEWPGTKTEKDPKCAVCGLKLHQLTP